MNNRRTALIYLVGVFLAGALAGGFAGFSWGRRPLFRPPNPQSMADHLVDHYRRDLALTEDQVRQIRPLVAQTTAEADGIHAATFERVHGLMTNLNRRIEAFLTPEQCQKLSECDRRTQARFRKKPGGPPPPR